MPHFGRALAVFLLSMILTFVGYLLFIIPWVVLMTFLVFCAILPFVGGHSIRSSFGMSARLVRFQGWFSTFFMVLGIMLIAFFFLSLDAWFVDNLLNTWGNNWSAIIDVTKYILYAVLTGIYYALIFVWVTVLYLSVDKQYHAAPVEYREKFAKPGCMMYGCLWFGLAAIVALIALFTIGIAGFRELKTMVLDDQPRVTQTMTGVIMSEDELGNYVEESFVQHSGALVLDQQFLQSVLGNVLEDVDGVGFYLTLSGEWLSVWISLPLDSYLLWSQSQYLNMESVFSFDLQDDQAKFSLKTWYFANTDWLDGLMGDTVFFWSDIINEVEDNRNPQAWDIAEWMRDIQSVSMKDGLIRIEFVE